MSSVAHRRGDEQRDLNVLDELTIVREVVEPFLTSLVMSMGSSNSSPRVRPSWVGSHVRERTRTDATGRRFTDVAEVYFFRVVDGRIVRAWGLEDTATSCVSWA